MFTRIKKWFLEKFWINKPIQFEGRIYTVVRVLPEWVTVTTPYFVKLIDNKNIDKINLVKINKDVKVGQVVIYYDQQTDENRTGIVESIGQDGTMTLDDGYRAHVNFVNKPCRIGKRRYKKGCIFKHEGKWYTINDCFLTKEGLAYNCIGYDLKNHAYLEKDIIRYNKQF